MIPELEKLGSDYQRVIYLQNLLIELATGKDGNDVHYQSLREYFIKKPEIKSLLPDWLKTNRNLSQFWQFIKGKFPKYKERKDFIWGELNRVLEYLESDEKIPFDESLKESLLNFDSASILDYWHKALERKRIDPEGAITMARTLLEGLCKHVLDTLGVDYKSNESEVSKLYKMVSKELNLSPEQHEEQIFKQILSGCSSIVSGLGSLRNELGDAHGKGKKKRKPSSRHAGFAVNLAGSMALFLVETFQARTVKNG